MSIDDLTPDGGPSPADTPGTSPDAPEVTAVDASEPDAEAPAPAAEAAAPAKRRWGLRKKRPAEPPGESEQATGVIPVPPAGDQPTEVIPTLPEEAESAPAGGGARLRRERSRLMARREEMLFHLGGLTFELYRRGRLSEGVARHRAGQIAELDDQVRAIDDQLLALEGVRKARRTRAQVVAVGPVESGCCLQCRSVFFDDARFCMQCGTRFAPPEPVAAAGAEAAGMTAVMPAAGAGDGEGAS